MKAWHWIIKDDKTKIVDLVEHFEIELEEARLEVKKVGIIEKISAELPAFHETRYSQLQAMETVLEFLEAEMKQLEAEKYKHFLEHYKRQLSSTDCKKYVDGDAEVVDLSLVISEVALIRNQLVGIVKSLEMKAYQLGHIVKLRSVGIEDSRLD